MVYPHCLGDSAVVLSRTVKAISSLPALQSSPLRYDLSYHISSNFLSLYVLPTYSPLTQSCPEALRLRCGLDCGTHATHQCLSFPVHVITVLQRSPAPASESHALHAVLHCVLHVVGHLTMTTHAALRVTSQKCPLLTRRENWQNLVQISLHPVWLLSA
jgi:hypothetical protein